MPSYIKFYFRTVSKEFSEHQLPRISCTEESPHTFMVIFRLLKIKFPTFHTLINHNSCVSRSNRRLHTRGHTSEWTARVKCRSNPCAPFVENFTLTLRTDSELYIKDDNVNNSGAQCWRRWLRLVITCLMWCTLHRHIRRIFSLLYTDISDVFIAPNLPHKKWHQNWQLRYTTTAID